MASPQSSIENSGIGLGQHLDNEGEESVGSTEIQDTRFPQGWSKIDHNFIISEMRALDEKARGNNKREFFKSQQYSNWEKMTEDQKNKSIAWFELLTDSVKSNIIYC